MTETVVILGGGVGGLVTANELRKALPKAHRVALVEREPSFVFAPSLLWLIIGGRTAETIGDVVSIPLTLGKPLPKAGVFAHYEAEVVARNIARAMTGKGRPATFVGEGECFVETGDGKAGFGKGNFYAEPTPQVKLHAPSRHWHAAKILFEKDSLRRWF